MLRTSLVTIVALALGASVGHAERRPSAEGLLQIVKPAARGEALAHPHVNVLARFGATEDRLAADPATFRARLGGTDITAEFVDIVENGVIVGKRAQISRERLKVGRGRVNRIRCSVSAARPSGRSRGRAIRDVDRVRFRVVDGPNTPPVAKLAEGSRSFRPGVPFVVDGSKSFDPDGDPVTIQWDFGDGTRVEGPTATHVYREFADRRVRLIVRDGGTNPDGTLSEATVEAMFLAEPVLPDGVEPGAVFVDSDTGLEFGVVAPGATAERVLTVQNVDDTQGHRIVARVVSDSGAFVSEPSLLELGPGERAAVTVRFAPTAEGHQHAQIALVLAAANRQVLRLLARGYGGSGGGTGPTLAGAPAFYTEFSRTAIGMTLVGVQPDGTRFPLDNTVYTCQGPSGSFAGGDVCVSDADCAPNGGTCQRSGVCYGGVRDRQPCAAVEDCPGGICSAAQTFAPVDLCSDGVGGIYLLSDEGTFTDPNPNADNELSATLLRVDVDTGARRTTGKRILQRIGADTTKIACDGFRPDDGGRVFVAEYRTDAEPPANCQRTDRELLVAVNKRTGTRQTIMPRVDAATGLRECQDDFDQVTHLEAARELRPGSAQAIFANFDSRGLWRIFPVPLQFLLPERYGPGNPPSVFPFEQFRVHPDGSLVLVGTGGGSVGGVVNVYRLRDRQVIGNPVQLSALVPCAAVTLPTNAIPTVTQGFTSVFGFAVGPADRTSRDATLLLSAAAGSQRLGEALGSRLNTRATVALRLPADSDECRVLGIVALEAFEQLTF